MWPKAKGWADRIPAAALPYTWQWWAFEARGEHVGRWLGDARPEHVRLEFSEPMISGYGDDEYDGIMRRAYDRWYDGFTSPRSSRWTASPVHGASTCTRREPEHLRVAPTACTGSRMS